MVDPSDTVGVRKEFLEAISNADAAFSGRVYPLDSLRVSFRIEDTWKGVFGASVTLPTGQQFHDDGTVSVSTCDPDFDLHRSYLILLYRNKAGELETSKCSVWTGAGMSARVRWLKRPSQ